jgi:hypothetical protein
MKKQIFILSVLLAFGLLFSKNTNAQGMEVGKNNLGIGVGLGHDYYSLVGITPAARLNFDHGFFNAGPGVITIGGSVGLSHSVYNNSWLGIGYKESWTNIVIASRGAWHYNFGKIGNENFNAYAGVGLGVRIERYSYTYDGNDPNFDPDNNYGDNYLHYATFIGGSYQFSEGFGIFAEVGYDITNVLFGANFRF